MEIHMSRGKGGYLYKEGGNCASAVLVCACGKQEKDYCQKIPL